MRARTIGIALLLVVASLSVGAKQADATYGVDEWRLRLYMLPPADALGNYACLTNPWHSEASGTQPNRALDWKATCGANGTELIRFRAVGVDVDSLFSGTGDAFVGIPTNMTPYACPYDNKGMVHVGLVGVWGFDGVRKGTMHYAHTVLYTTSGSEFNINVAGTTLSTGYLTSIGIGDTKADGSGTGGLTHTECWKGWHVHENNSYDTVSLWDYWNTGVYNTADPNDLFLNSNRSNYTRRLTWTAVPFE